VKGLIGVEAGISQRRHDRRCSALCWAAGVHRSMQGALRWPAHVRLHACGWSNCPRRGARRWSAASKMSA